MLTETKNRAFYKHKRQDCWHKNVLRRTRTADVRYRDRKIGRDYPVFENNKREDWVYTDRYNVLRQKARAKKERISESNSSLFEKQFNELAARWKKETGHYSTMIHVTRNENYLRVIALGKPAIPFILKDLEKEPDYWFEALRLLTNHNPVPKNHLGDLEEMTTDWLNWGRKERLI